MRAAEISSGYVQSACPYTQTTYRAISQAVSRHLRLTWEHMQHTEYHDWP